MIIRYKNWRKEGRLNKFNTLLCYYIFHEDKSSLHTHNRIVYHICKSSLNIRLISPPKSCNLDIACIYFWPSPWNLCLPCSLYCLLDIQHMSSSHEIYTDTLDSNEFCTEDICTMLFLHRIRKPHCSRQLGTKWNYPHYSIRIVWSWIYHTAILMINLASYKIIFPSEPLFNGIFPQDIWF